MTEQNGGEILNQEAQAVITENDLGAREVKDVELPAKFKDVNALLNAYNSLQAEFTKRCQKVKELEGKLNADKENSPVDVTGEPQATVNGITEENKLEILKGYLKDVALKGQKVIVMSSDGVGVKAPANKPKSIREAGILAKEILN